MGINLSPAHGCLTGPSYEGASAKEAVVVVGSDVAEPVPGIGFLVSVSCSFCIRRQHPRNATR